MISDKKFIYDYREKNDYSDFQFISSWEKNFMSWKNQKIFPVKIIKYENLLDKTYAVFEDLIKFINNVTNNNQSINKKRLKNSINSSSFEKLKDYENKYGFSESIKSKNYNKAIPFFHLGPNNDWKKILEDDLKKKLNVTFNKSLKFFSYI